MSDPVTITPVSAEGLDFADPDDRAIYRQRVVNAFKNCNVRAIVRYAQQAGSGYARPNPKRHEAIRALADAWIQTSTDRTTP